jgi:hypothetical protein
MKYKTDDGDFSNIPAEVKQYIFSFLRGSPIVSGVCKSFKDANAGNLRSLLSLMHGKVYKIDVSLTPFLQDYCLLELYYTKLVGEESDIDKFFNLLARKSLREGWIDSLMGFANYIHVCFSIKKEKLQQFLIYIDELKIKSNDCKIEKPLKLMIEDAEEFAKNNCSLM